MTPEDLEVLRRAVARFGDAICFTRNSQDRAAYAESRDALRAIIRRETEGRDG